MRYGGHREWAKGKAAQHNKQIIMNKKAAHHGEEVDVVAFRDDDRVRATWGVFGGLEVFVVRGSFHVHAGGVFLAALEYVEVIVAANTAFPLFGCLASDESVSRPHKQRSVGGIQ